MTRELLEKTINDYIRVSQKGDIDAVMDYMYPGLFKLVPRQVLSEKMKEAFEGNDWNDYVDDLSVSSISDAFDIEGTFFCKVTYVISLKSDPHSGLVQKLLEGEDVNYDSIDEYVEFVMKIATLVYGEGNVRYDTQQDVLRFQQINEMLAVYEKDATGWKVIKWSSGTMYKRIFPAKTVKKLATYFFLMD